MLIRTTFPRKVSGNDRQSTSKKPPSLVVATLILKSPPGKEGGGDAKQGDDHLTTGPKLFSYFDTRSVISFRSIVSS